MKEPPKEEHQSQDDGGDGNESSVKVPPWVQLVGLPMALVFGWVFVSSASHAVTMFLVATIISLILNPIVRTMTVSGVPRPVAVFSVFSVFCLIMTIVVIVSVNVVVEQSAKVNRNLDNYVKQVQKKVDDTQDFLDDRGVEVNLREQGMDFVAQIEERGTELSGEALTFGREFVAVIAEAAFNLVLTVVITVYMLLDAPRIGRFISSMFPKRTNVEGLFKGLERSLLRYVWGQTLASVVMGVSAAIGLWIIGVTGIWPPAAQLAPIFGLIVAITEFAPSIGPVLGSIPPIVAAMFDGLIPALVVLVFFLALHQIEGHIVIPLFMGAAIAVHPLIVIFGILAGAQIMGIGGILLALPLLAILREITMWIIQRVRLGEWPDGTASLVPAPVTVAVGAGATESLPINNQLEDVNADEGIENQRPLDTHLAKLATWKKRINLKKRNNRKRPPDKDQ